MMMIPLIPPAVTATQSGYKICSRCGEDRGSDSWKPVRNRHGNMVVGKICIHCLRASARARMKKRKESSDPEYLREQARASKRKQRASRTEEEWRAYRATWKENQGRPNRPRSDVTQIAKYDRIKRLLKTVGLRVFRDWHQQTHSEQRREIERVFLDIIPSKYPGMNNSDIYKYRYNNDETFRIKERCRRQIQKKVKEVYGTGYVASVLKHNKKRSSLVESLIGCTIDHLRESLQAGLAGTIYCWNDFLKGELHIDHIIPKTLFDIKDHVEVRLCWDVNNLRLISKTYNLQKGCKVVATMINTRQEILMS